MMEKEIKRKRSEQIQKGRKYKRLYDRKVD
jgi:hypothetical protein